MAGVSLGEAAKRIKAGEKGVQSGTDIPKDQGTVPIYDASGNVVGYKPAVAEPSAPSPAPKPPPPPKKEESDLGAAAARKAGQKAGLKAIAR
jgi:hypothetical protein